MSVPISETLAAHQAGALRRPAVAVTISPTRGGMAILRWERLYTGSEAAAPHAAAITGDGSLIRARNASGSLVVSRATAPGPGASFGSWSSIATCASGVGVALAASSSEVLLASVQPGGLTIEVRRSVDDGQTWTAQALVAEASAVGSVALALNPAGDACVFYTLGTSTTLKRLRRVSGTWAGSGTNWSRSGSVASISGVSACHDGGDFVLLVTGTLATTNHRRCWAVRMGDLGLPANAWSALIDIAEADAASTVSFASPAVAAIGSELRGMFVRRDSGPVASDQGMETRPMATTGAAGWWSDAVSHEAAVSDGLALCSVASGDAWCATPSGVWRATRPAALEAGAAVTAFRFELGRRRARCTIELDDCDGAVSSSEALFPGATVLLRPGYETAEGAEYGCMLEFEIERVVRTVSGGRATVTVHGCGPWEQAASSRAVQAWASEGALTRAQIFLRLASRAGIAAAGAGAPREPGGEWTSDTPPFVVVPGETTFSALDRLLQGIPAEVVPDGGLLVTSVDPADATDGQYAGAGEHPILAFDTIDEQPSASWVRVQGSGRTADAFDPQRVMAGGAGPLVVHDRGATTDDAVTARAAAILAKHQRTAPAARVRIGFDTARQLWDVVEVAGQRYRVIGIDADYRRGPRGARYEQTLTLGELS